MCRLLAATLFALCLTTAGCSVLEEMGTPGTGAPADASESAADRALKTKNELLEQSKQWWDEATSLSPTGVDSKIVSCRIQGSTQFMARDDCLVQGGRPADVSG